MTPSLPQTNRGRAMSKDQIIEAICSFVAMTLAFAVLFGFWVLLAPFDTTSFAR